MSDEQNNAYERPEGWYASGDYGAYKGPPKRNRGLKVFFLIIAVIVACTLLALSGIGIYSLFSGGGLPWLNVLPQEQKPAPEIEQEEPQGDPNGPELNIEDRPDNPIYGEQASGMGIPEIAAKVRPSVVGVLSETESSVLSGSGVIMSETGYIITNAHVIENGGTVTIVTEDDTRYEARIVGADRKTDLAVLKIEGENLTPAEFGSSSDLVVGELAVAIGNPLGMELFGSVTAGIISALDRKITFEDRTMVLIQTDAAINPGNSGGALVNGYGQIIGINSAKIVSEGYTGTSYEGLGFAIPIDSAKPIVDSLIKLGYVPGRPVIGIVGEDVTPYYSEFFRRPQGVYIHGVTEGTDAVGKGIQAGDIVVAINGTRITSMTELNEIKDQFKTGDVVTLTIDRAGKEYDINITLTESKG
jgi:serine protease Do